ncbi:MAG: hypothetical protein H6741_22100 [Alphaproteobacteria bacterium]|nr:hypothetical protein [Alphaproteobacteria bacterium]
MSLAQMHRNKRGGGGGGAGGAGAAEALAGPLQEDAGYSNDFMARLIADAAEQEGQSGLVDLARTLGVSNELVEGFYDFAEDGDDQQQQAKPERRQQESDLPELREKHADKQYEDFEQGTAFVQGSGDAQAVDPNDVSQGALGDCYLMAAMAAVARANPSDIEKIVKDNGDGTFDVTLYIRPRRYARPEPVTTTIDARLPTKYSGKALYAQPGDQSGDQQELWPALIEKAVAQQKGSYEDISGGNIAKDGFQFHGATELLTGERESYYALDKLGEDDALLEIAVALESKQAVTVDSKNMQDDPGMTKDANALNIYGNHAYVPVDVNLDARTLNLQNPWGSHHVSDLSIAEFMRFYRSIRIGGGA